MSLAKHRIIITKKKKTIKSVQKFIQDFVKFLCIKPRFYVESMQKSAQVFKAKFYQSLVTIPPFACVASLSLPT